MSKRIDYSCPYINSVINFLNSLPEHHQKREAVNNLNQIREINEDLRKLSKDMKDQNKKIVADTETQLHTYKTVMYFMVIIVAILLIRWPNANENIVKVHSTDTITVVEYVYLPEKIIGNKKSPKLFCSED